MKKIHYAIIGVIVFLVGTFVVLPYIVLSGRCLLTHCETEIEIISFEMPDIVYAGNRIQAEFIVKNKGDVTAENCVLEWALAETKGSTDKKLSVFDEQFSKTFQLSPLEEIKIESSSKSILYPSGENYNPGISTLALVVCDNTESAKIPKNTQLIRP